MNKRSETPLVSPAPREPELDQEDVANLHLEPAKEQRRLQRPEAKALNDHRFHQSRRAQPHAMKVPGRQEGHEPWKPPRPPSPPSHSSARASGQHGKGAPPSYEDGERFIENRLAKEVEPKRELPTLAAHTRETTRTTTTMATTTATTTTAPPPLHVTSKLDHVFSGQGWPLQKKKWRRERGKESLWRQRRRRHLRLNFSDLKPWAIANAEKGKGKRKEANGNPLGEWRKSSKLFFLQF